VVNPAGSVGTALGAREGFEYTLIPTDVLIAQEPGGRVLQLPLFAWRSRPRMSDGELCDRPCAEGGVRDARALAVRHAPKSVILGASVVF
jgi:hypothetical protein